MKRLRFIKQAQALGFTLTEVATLLSLNQAGLCSETRTLAMHKLALFEQKMADLAAMQKVLGNLVQQCQQGSDATFCPIIDVLAQE